MLITCSSSSNESSPLHRPPSIPANSFDLRCFVSTQTMFIFIAFWTVRVSLLILLCIIILYHAIQQQWQKRLTSSSAAPSHSDIFTYHLVIIELIGVLGNILCYHGALCNDLSMLFWGALTWFFCWHGESLFQTLTCLEHYLAVVHPITYMHLRNETGIRIRNASIGCAWLLCFVGMASMMSGSVFIILNFCIMVLVLLIVSFCCLAVLRVLIRQGPGEQRGARERADQSKKRAFHTILAILGTLLLRFLGSLSWVIVYASEVSSKCLILACVGWFTLPSCLVLPLLFLHRAGKFMCFWKSSD